MFSLLLVIVSVVYYFLRIVNPIIFVSGEQNVSRIVTMSCNDAISQVSSEILYDNLMSIGYNADGSISFIKANSEKINKISNTLAQVTQLNLDKNSSYGYKIAMGTLSGIGFLSGKGNLINFAINPIGNVICRFNTSFTEAGINQTLHKIFVTIETEISLILPFQSKVITKCADFLISECVIIGKIPQTYLNISDIDQLK